MINVSIFLNFIIIIIIIIIIITIIIIIIIIMICIDFTAYGWRFSFSLKEGYAS